jgi:hypothetical protein
MPRPSVTILKAALYAAADIFRGRTLKTGSVSAGHDHAANLRCDLSLDFVIGLGLLLRLQPGGFLTVHAEARGAPNLQYKHVNCIIKNWQNEPNFF